MIGSNCDIAVRMTFNPRHGRAASEAKRDPATHFSTKLFPRGGLATVTQQTSVVRE
jgi:hypothetical protein